MMPPFRATEMTAFFAGVWGFIGINATRALEGVPSNLSGTSQVVWILAFAIFLFIPTYVFVAGIQSPEMREAEMGEMRKFGMFAPATVKRFGQMLKRGLYWLAGALAGALTTGLVSRLVLFVGGRL